MEYGLEPHGRIHVGRYDVLWNETIDRSGYEPWGNGWPIDDEAAMATGMPGGSHGN